MQELESKIDGLMQGKNGWGSLNPCVIFLKSRDLP